MCTAVLSGGLFGRTLDLEYSYGEKLVITPQKYTFNFINEKSIEEHFAIIGVAHVSNGFPLYYDAINERGLGVAALNFPGNAVYRKTQSGKHNIATFELIPWILSKCDSVDSAIDLIEKTNITSDNFSPELPTTPLHWIIADKDRAVTVESVDSGIKIYENPFGVLTNNPPFPYHLTRVTDFLSVDSHPKKNTLCPSLEFEQYSRGMGGIGLPGDYSSSSRFVRAVFASNHTSTDKPQDASRFFHIMETVSVPKGAVKTAEGKDVYTVYTSCADLISGAYYFTTYGCRQICSVKLNESVLDSQSLSIFEMRQTEDVKYYN